MSKCQRKRAEFQLFCCQLYHRCLEIVFEPLKPYMETHKVVRCPDGHFRRAIFSLGPYIADYPEQVWLAGIGVRSKLYMFYCLYIRNSYFYIDVMPCQMTLMVQEVTAAHTRRRTFSLKLLTLVFCGMTSGFGMTLWFVSICFNRHSSLITDST